MSGAHLYGFPSPDSDWDLRGVHVLPLRSVLGSDTPEETHNLERDDGSVELDLVTHDAWKFARLLLSRNGYVLEQLLSPLVVHTTPAHGELAALARRCVTRHHAHHYLGFTHNQWEMLEGEEVPRVKPLLYAFRTVLTRLHLLRTGEVEANLEVLNAGACLPFLADLMALKREGREGEPLPEPARYVPGRPPAPRAGTGGGAADHTPSRRRTRGRDPCRRRLGGEGAPQPFGVMAAHVDPHSHDRSPGSALPPYSVW
ncbi:hypothetical protein DAETH_31950 [Deinococcus aetherius]|uniref:Nucleotidyltransferase n=1 Tax=Deinococcus aetherius TaxID=200252 RepID=A0ABM8AHD7_9DEIO|nr:nucleotidyltransferase domain-containing protein [Deinococcus aetherius]BDP43226.1 hypothetical protein DAETH_31950 [Deinococcus aetherius]